MVSYENIIKTGQVVIINKKKMPWIWMLARRVIWEDMYKDKE